VSGRRLMEEGISRSGTYIVSRCTTITNDETGRPSSASSPSPPTQASSGRAMMTALRKDLLLTRLDSKRPVVLLAILAMRNDGRLYMRTRNGMARAKRLHDIALPSPLRCLGGKSLACLYGGLTSCYSAISIFMYDRTFA
jgi:hypothetical protein